MIPYYLIPNFNPIPNPLALVKAPPYRITCLTSRLLRIEYNPDENFEDRPSQIFWYRNTPPPEFTSRIKSAQSQNEDGHELEVETADLQLNILLGRPPSPETLSIKLKKYGHTWHLNDHNPGNLKGTYRTLDNRKGHVPLEPGILSRDGWAVIDDSKTLVFNEEGWLEPRSNKPEALDLYFFGYSHDYQDCIRDYRKLTGSVPLLPRWALGNWWSRYWAYSQDQILSLIQDFQDHEVPLSVIIIDMDWHITDTGNKSSGWTGYTWNRELFPDPPNLIQQIHKFDLRTALNLHPADGIYPHEEQYQDFARRLGRNTDSVDPIPFNLADPNFTLAYFDLLHHPQEEIGIDFWWIDWQQGTLSSLPGLDPLYWLNHLHFLDLARPVEDKEECPKRPFIFSRWAGFGGHRYPIGFSGDTIVSWESLAYQPFFTATAANVSYGWWSHDIGGHMDGIEEPELYLRWLQFGVFSPILRLHSTNNPFHERRPWAFNAEISWLATDAMRLRHRLIPYLYAMAFRDHKESESLIRPMYHLQPETEASYYAPDNYTFGSELIAAPYISPINSDTRLSRQVIWLPEGSWYDFFTGQIYNNGHHVVYGDLSEIPLFAREGAIIPLAQPPLCGYTEKLNPLQLNIFPGNDNTYLHYEDDGFSTGYLAGAYALTPFRIKSFRDGLDFYILPAEGDPSQCINPRKYELLFRCIQEPNSCVLKVNNHPVSISPKYDQKKNILFIPIDFDISPSDEVLVELRKESGLYKSEDNSYSVILEKCENLIKHFRLETYTKQGLFQALPDIIKDPGLLARVRPRVTDDQLRALLETITRTGVHRFFHHGDDHIIMWDHNSLIENFPTTYQLSVNQLRRGYYEKPYHYESGPIPEFQVFHPPTQFGDNPWELILRYGDVLTIKLSSKDKTMKNAPLFTNS